MRKRAPMLVASLAMAGIAASVALAAPISADSSTGPKLDKLHAARPTAASNPTFQTPGIAAGAITADQVRQVVSYVGYLQMQSLADYLNQVVFQEYLDGLTAAAAAEAAARASTYTPPPIRTVSSYSSSPGGFLACVRNRESGGDYTAVNASSGAAGAYQFLQSTWNSVAASIGRGDLVGVNPAQASPADQDAMAEALYAQQGAAPWGGACS